MLISLYLYYSHFIFHLCNIGYSNLRFAVEQKPCVIKRLKNESERTAEKFPRLPRNVRVCVCFYRWHIHGRSERAERAGRRLVRRKKKEFLFH